jgi:predicted ATPase/predicted negative regulator of RcsB-dependent stress response
MSDDTQRVRIFDAPLIGRKTELDRLSTLYQERRRLIHITGPPGAGKSVLAQTFVSLGGTHRRCISVDMKDEASLQAVLEATANALNMTHLRGDQVQVLSQIGNSLASREIDLLVLDNCDGVLSALNRCATAWIGASEDLTVLVTARGRLDIPSARIVHLNPFSLPEHRMDRAEFERHPAGELFMREVGQALPDFEPTPEQLNHCIDIVKCVDGLPLAIQIAARRLRVLSPNELLSRLRSNTNVLKGKGLFRGLETSWRALETNESTLLEQLAIFQGSFDFNAMEAVLETDEDIIEVIQRLVEASLLLTFDVTSKQGTHRRYRVLATLRDFIRSKQEAVPVDTRLLQRHMTYFADLGYEAAENHRQRDSPWSNPLLRSEKGNMVKALGSAILAVQEGRADCAEHAAKLGLALLGIYISAGPLENYLQLLKPLESWSEKLSAGLEMRLLVATGQAKAGLARWQEAFELTKAASQIADELEDHEFIGWTQLLMARLHNVNFQVDEGLKCVERAMKAFNTAKNQWAPGLTAIVMGNLCNTQGKIREGATYLDQGLAILRSHGATIALSEGLCQAVGLARNRGDLVKAVIYGQEALTNAFNKDTGTNNHLGYRAAGLLGDVYAHAFHFETAHELQTLSTRLSERNGSLFYAEFSRYTQADCYFDAGEFDRALDGYNQVRLFCQQHGYTEMLGQSLASIALLHWAMGQLEAATTWGRQACALLEQAGAMRWGAVTYAMLGAIETTKNDEMTARAAFDKGRALSSTQDAHGTMMVELYREHLTLLEARQTRQSGDTARAEELEDKATERLISVLIPTAEQESGWVPPARCSYYLRFAARRLAAGLPSRCRYHVFDATQGDERKDSLVWDASKHRVRLPDKTWTDISNNSSLQRLVDGFFSEPTKHWNQDDIVALVWPGERMVAKAATNRVYKVMSQLRGAGLGDWLESKSGTYRLTASGSYVTLAADASSPSPVLDPTHKLPLPELDTSLLDGL